MPACGRLEVVAPPPPSHRMRHAASIVTVPVIDVVAIPETSSRREAALYTPMASAESTIREPRAAHVAASPPVYSHPTANTKRPPPLRRQRCGDGPRPQPHRRPLLHDPGPRGPATEKPDERQTRPERSWWSASSTPGQGAPYGRSYGRYIPVLTRGH
jgi:hypothetical protein